MACVARHLASRIHYGRGWVYGVGGECRFVCIAVGPPWCDANMRSAWVCTRNDVLGNLAVLLAALGVFGSGTGWPDVLVAAIMASLALQGASIVIQQAGIELQSPRRTIAFSAE